MTIRMVKARAPGASVTDVTPYRFRRTIPYTVTCGPARTRSVLAVEFEVRCLLGARATLPMNCQETGQ
jgi:hypothetical protein